GPALELYLRALAIKEATLDLGNLGIGYTTFNIGETLRELHRFADAYPYYRRARDIFVAKLGAEHKLTASASFGLGLRALETARAAEAIEPLERALALRQAAAASVEDLEATRSALARARSAAGRR